MAPRPEEQDPLAAFAALVRLWSPRINLVAAQDLPILEARHIADSVQVLEGLDPAPRRWADLGSGGGFPGIVVACLLRDRGTSVHLVESDQRKAAFLRRAARALDLPRLTVHATRIEALEPLGAAVVSARALAPLPKLLPLVHRHLAPDGTALLMKGANWETEVAQARRSWHFDLQTRPSATDPRARILHVTKLSPQDRHGDRQPEGGRGQDDHRRQPRGGAGGGGQ